MTSAIKHPKYVRCKLKNIAVVWKHGELKKGDYHLEYVNHLPNDCIRLNNIAKWCDDCWECML